MKKKTGLVLSGGGARGAYQVGVLKGITEISLAHGNPRPFEIVTGFSAGAVNAYYWASHADDVKKASDKLVEYWSNLSSDRIFHTDVFSLGWIGLQWLLELLLGKIFYPNRPRSLLDTSPLYEMINQYGSQELVQKNIDAGAIRGLGITAVDYHTSHSVTFIQGMPDIELWTRTRRVSRKMSITPAHIMASAAIPIFFPATYVQDRFYGDGSLRNSAPLSPAIHMGADQLIIISVRKQRTIQSPPPASNRQPTFGKILGSMMNSLLMDAIDADVERLSRINKTISLIPESEKRDSVLKPIEYIWITPSLDLGLIAGQEAHHHPPLIRYLLGGMGGKRDAREITSYLLFEAAFCKRLIEIGYRDAMAQKDQIAQFVKG